jgi:hypothetical protein
MLITAEWFESLSKNLRSTIADPGASAKGAANRRHARVGIRSSTNLRHILPDGRITAVSQVTVRDFSAEGVGILLSKRLNKGERFMLELPREDGAVLRLLYSVMQSDRLTESLFAVGAKLMGARNIELPVESRNHAEQPESKSQSDDVDSRAAEIRKRMFESADTK